MQHLGWLQAYARSVGGSPAIGIEQKDLAVARQALPPFLEPRRAQIEAGLKPIG